MYDVIVIGSGVSGLYSAKLLHEQGLRVVVVESDQIIGGRTRQNSTFTQWPVELGGEMIHGQDTLYYQLAKENGWEIFEVFEEDMYANNRKSTYFYLGREKRLVGPDQRDKDMDRLLGELEEICDLKDSTIKKDLNLAQYLTQRGVPFRMLGLADAIYSKTWGTNLDRIGLKQASIEDKKYHKIPKNFKLQKSSKQLVEWCAKGQNILVNWKATSIDYNTPNSIIVSNDRGEQLKSKKVIVTVPLTILKDSDIEFNPVLPSDKREAINVMQMDGGMKIILKFTHKFWKQEVELVLCADSMVPQIWMDGAPQRPVPAGQQPEYVVVGFITGDQAKSVSALSEKNQVLGFLDQLDQMFRDGTNGERPASSCFLGHMVWDWQKHPHVRGAYSFPCAIPTNSSISSNPNVILSQPVNDQLYFAGEATATTYEMATINGALQTAVRVSKQVLNNIKLINSKL